MTLNLCVLTSNWNVWDSEVKGIILANFVSSKRTTLGHKPLCNLASYGALNTLRTTIFECITQECVDMWCISYYFVAGLIQRYRL